MDGKKRKPARSRIKTPFAENLKHLLSERKLPLREAARMSGVSPGVLHAWLQGAVPQDLSAVLKLSKELKADFQWLLTGTQSGISASEISLNQVFDVEDAPSFSGIFMIEAKRLRKR